MATYQPTRTFDRLLRRLGEAGFSRDFVRQALLPDWWSDDAARDSSLLQEVEIAVARFLRAPLENVRDPDAKLHFEPSPGRLRKPKTKTEADLAAAMFAGSAIAAAVVRNLRNIPDFAGLPEDADALRETLLEGYKEAITLRVLAGGLWVRGIPVVQATLLPRQKFRAMACLANGRPVIVLGYSLDEQPKLLWDIAHEAAHIARGHLSGECPSVVDVDDTESDGDDAAFEREANDFARRLLLGGSPSFALNLPPELQGPRELARAARHRARVAGVDSGLLVHFWAGKTNKQGLARFALQHLEKLGGRKIATSFVTQYVDVDGASETDANLLRCVLSGSSDASRA